MSLDLGLCSSMDIAWEWGKKLEKITSVRTLIWVFQHLYYKLDETMQVYPLQECT